MGERILTRADRKAGIGIDKVQYMGGKGEKVVVPFGASSKTTRRANQLQAAINAQKKGPSGRKK